MIYSFEEIINYFSEKLKAEPPREDVEEGEVELSLDGVAVSLRAHPGGGVCMKLELGLLSSPLSEPHLLTLSHANFLGSGTAGCSFCIDEDIGLVLLKAITPTATSPQENWEWLQRIWAAGHYWAHTIEGWEEFIPLAHFPDEEPLKPPTLSMDKLKA